MVDSDCKNTVKYKTNQKSFCDKKLQKQTRLQMLVNHHISYDISTLNIG